MSIKHDSAEYDYYSIVTRILTAGTKAVPVNTGLFAEVTALLQQIMIRKIE